MDGEPPVNGKVCIVTGANTGIGLETAAALVAQGATVVLACRDEAKAREAIAEINARGGKGAAHFMPLNLASLQSVRDFAASFQHKFNRLDVVVNNAGIMPGKRQITIEGFEMILGVNHLGHYLLTRDLLGLLRRSVPARVVVVASAMHHRGDINFNDLQSETKYGPMGVYSNSKLANVMFTYALARRLEGSGVTANCLHPGVVGTQIIRKQIGDYPAIVQPLGSLFLAFTLSPEKGARTSVHLASSPEVEGISGKYFVRCKPAQSSARSHDVAAQEKLWETSARLTGLDA
jgi:retinol dehydrogenase-12